METETPEKTWHTPTPWRVKEVKYGDSRTGTLENSEGVYLGEITDDRVTPEIAIANANYVICAINAHEYLLDVLRGLKADIESGNFGERGAVEMIDAAVEKAEKRF